MRNCYTVSKLVNNIWVPCGEYYQQGAADAEARCLSVDGIRARVYHCYGSTSRILYEI